MKHQTSLSSRLRQVVMAAAVVACAVPLAIAVAGPLDWVGGAKVQGSGKVQKQTRALAHFTGVNLNVPGDMELRLGNTESITIETDDNLLPLIESVIEDGVLKIRPVKRNTNLHTRNMKIVVTAKSIDRLALSGSGSINVKGIDAEAVAISLGGSGDMKSGAGRTNTMSVSIGGSGDVDVGQVEASDASVSVAGSGEAIVWARSGLSVTIAGSGDVNYYGDPKISRSVVGSGDVNRMGAAP